MAAKWNRTISCYVEVRSFVQANIPKSVSLITLPPVQIECTCSFLLTYAHTHTHTNISYISLRIGKRVHVTEESASECRYQSITDIRTHKKNHECMSSMVPGVMWLEVQVIYLQNTWLTSAECEGYIAGLYCLFIKPCTSYLWCGAGFRNSSLSIKPCTSYFSQYAVLRLEVRIIALYKTVYFLPFTVCNA